MISYLFDVSLDPSSLSDWITRGGLVGVLAFALLANFKGWWISKREASKMERRIDYLEKSNASWMELAFKATKISEEVTTIVRKSNEAT